MKLQTRQTLDKEARQARKRANALLGNLANTSKMPSVTRTGCNVSTGSSYATSAFDCRTGSILRKVAGSVCSKCYACKGRQAMPSVQSAYNRRMAAYRDLGPQAWADAMVAAIDENADFRFFDSGDLADYAQLLAIVDVATRRPDVRFWLPTKEYADVARLRRENVAVPSNLVIRLSVPMMNEDAPSYGTRSVVFHASRRADIPANAKVCHCSEPENPGPATCGDCRNCWDSSVDVVCYLAH